MARTSETGHWEIYEPAQSINPTWSCLGKCRGGGGGLGKGSVVWWCGGEAVIEMDNGVVVVEDVVRWMDDTVEISSGGTWKMWLEMSGGGRTCVVALQMVQFVFVLLLYYHKRQA